MRRESGFVGSGAGSTGRVACPDLDSWLEDLAGLDPESYDEQSALAAITALEKLKRGHPPRLTVNALRA
jgi:hypothetical protein